MVFNLGGRSCSVPQCSNSVRKALNKKENVSFYPYPDVIKDKHRHKEWVVKLKNGKKPSRWAQVCCQHFKNEDFVLSKTGKCKKRFLKKDAIPSENLPTRPAETRLSCARTSREKRLTRRETSVCHRETGLILEESATPAVNSAADEPRPGGEHFLATYPFETVTLPGSLFLEETASASTSTGPPGTGTYNKTRVGAPKKTVIEHIAPSPKGFALRPNIPKKFDEPSSTVTSAENVQNTLSSLCRLCTKPCSVFVQLYSLEPGEAPTSSSEKQISLTEKILAVTGMKLVNDGILPWHICVPCNRRIVEWYDFKKLCIANEIRFRTLAAEIAASRVARETSPPSEPEPPTKRLRLGRTTHKEEPSHHNYPPDETYFADPLHESHSFVGAIEHEPQMNPVEEFQCVSADLNDDSVDIDCKQLIQPSFSREDAGSSNYESFDDGTVSEIECKPQITSIQFQYLPQEQNASESGGIAADTDSQPVRIEPCFVSVKEEPIEEPPFNDTPIDDTLINEDNCTVNRQSHKYQSWYP